MKGFTFRLATPVYLVLVAHAPTVIVTIGSTGYTTTTGQADTLPDDVSEAALAGSMFGWECTAAQPAINWATAGLVKAERMLTDMIEGYRAAEQSAPRESCREQAKIDGDTMKFARHIIRNELHGVTK